MSVEFGDRLEKVRFAEFGITVNERHIPWHEVGALGILENASRTGAVLTHHGRIATKVTGCLAVCVIHDVDVVPAFGLLLDCIATRPSSAERERAIAFLQDQLGSLWPHGPQFAPANVRVEHWWREQVYGPGSHAHTDLERVKELREEFRHLND